MIAISNIISVIFLFCLFLNNQAQDSFELDIEGIETDLLFDQNKHSDSELKILDFNNDDQAAMLRVVSALREARLVTEKLSSSNEEIDGTNDESTETIFSVPNIQLEIMNVESLKELSSNINELEATKQNLLKKPHLKLNSLAKKLTRSAFLATFAMLITRFLLPLFTTYVMKFDGAAVNNMKSSFQHLLKSTETITNIKKLLITYFNKKYFLSLAPNMVIPLLWGLRFTVLETVSEILLRTPIKLQYKLL